MSESSNSSSGFSAGVSFSPTTGLGANLSVSAGGGNSQSAVVSNQTSILGTGDVTIDVGENTNIDGAVVAAVDADSLSTGTLVDTGRLSLSTGTLSVTDLQDTAASRQTDAGLSVSINDPLTQGIAGTNLPSLDVSRSTADFEQNTAGVIGSGTVEVRDDDSFDTDTLNRDINDTQIVTRDEETNLRINADIATISTFYGEDGNSTIEKAADNARIIRREIRARQISPEEAQAKAFGLLDRGDQNTGITDLLDEPGFEENIEVVTAHLLDAGVSEATVEKILEDPDLALAVFGSGVDLGTFDERNSAFVPAPSEGGQRDEDGILVVNIPTDGPPNPELEDFARATGRIGLRIANGDIPFEQLEALELAASLARSTNPAGALVAVGKFFGGRAAEEALEENVIGPLSELGANALLNRQAGEESFAEFAERTDELNASADADLIARQEQIALNEDGTFSAEEVAFAEANLAIFRTDDVTLLANGQDRRNETQLGIALGAALGIGLAARQVSKKFKQDKDQIDTRNERREPRPEDSEAGDPEGNVPEPGRLEQINRNAGGKDHLFDRHTGKSDQDLIDRANGANGQTAPRDGASAFSSREAAEFYSGEIISRRSADIQAHIASGSTGTKAFDVEFGQSTGRWVPNGGSAAQNVTASRIVIKPDPSAPDGFRIITGFPIPKVDPGN